MAHPVTRLTPQTGHRDPRMGGGGKPEISREEIAQAAGSLSTLQYWAVMAYVCDQHPNREEWPRLLLELKRLTVEAWERSQHPKNMTVPKLIGISSCAWKEFIAPRTLTLEERAKLSGISVPSYRFYSHLQTDANREIHSALSEGLRRINKNLR